MLAAKSILVTGGSRGIGLATACALAAGSPRGPPPRLGASYVAAYTASKHAVLGLVRAAAAEYGGRGITVNAICPGYVDTDMTRRSLQLIAQKTGLSPDQARERVLSRMPQHRLIKPDEV